MCFSQAASTSWSDEMSWARRHGNEKGARVLAKSLVRLRGQRTKVLASSAQLRGVRASIGVSNNASRCSRNDYPRHWFPLCHHSTQSSTRVIAVCALRGI